MNEEKITLPQKLDIKLDDRLRCAASFVRCGSVAADVGTDHAYLPIFLTVNGICPRAVGSDINEGPINRARENVDKYGLGDRITLIHTDGLRGLESTGAKDIIICGMGGEMIIDIIRNAQFVFSGDARLILQPMTKQAKLRQYLTESGFAIEDERLVKSGGKLYQCICASWRGTESALAAGVPTELTPASLTQYSAVELLLGRANIERGETGDGLFTDFIDKVIGAKTKQLNGKISGNANIEKEHALLGKLKEIKDEIGRNI